LQAVLDETSRLMVQTPILDRRRRRKLAAEGLYWATRRLQPIDRVESKPSPWRFLGVLWAVLGFTSAIWSLWSAVVLFVIGVLWLLFWPKRRIVVTIMPQVPPQAMIRDIPSPKALAVTMRRNLETLQHWCHHLLARAEGAKTAEVLQWPSRRSAGTILDTVLHDWKSELARRCAEDVREDRDRPQRWIEALLAEWEYRQPDLDSLEWVFTRHAAERWLASRTWEEMIAMLQPHPGWLGRYFEQALAPSWSEVGQDHDIDSGLVALDEPLWKLVGPRDDQDVPYRLLLVEWPKPGTVVLVRLVQGLTPGTLKKVCYERRSTPFRQSS
jgi:hypothetical protein